jgi:ArsR family transcriptional regulator, arsenate/arsenite/antimonite-responsive transcriptional repressor
MPLGPKIRGSRLLIKHEPIGITAGVIAETVGAPHNTLSSHLAILVRAGLLRSSRDGRTIVYRSDGPVPNSVN